MANEYEITYLSDPQLNDEARAELDASVDAEIGQIKGAILHSAAPMRRRLMYPIQKKMAAFSRTVQVTVQPEDIQGLRTALRKKSGIVRLMVLSTTQRAGVAADIFTQVNLDEKKTTEKKPAKPVTMQEVEKGIEDALQEEVK
jgi:ribosomal protein S6